MSKRASGVFPFGFQSKARVLNLTQEASNGEKRQKRPCLNVEEWGLTVTGPPKEPGYMVEVLRESYAKGRTDYLDDMPEDWPGDVSKGLGPQHLVGNVEAGGDDDETMSMPGVDVSLNHGDDDFHMIPVEQDYPQGSPSPSGSQEMERESSGNDLEVGEETGSVKDMSLGSMDESFLRPEDGGIQWLQDLDQVLKGCDLKKYRAKDVKNIVRYFTEKERVPQVLPASFKVPEGKGFSSRILWFMKLLSHNHQKLQEAIAGMDPSQKKLVGKLIITAAEKLVKYV